MPASRILVGRPSLDPHVTALLRCITHLQCGGCPRGSELQLPSGKGWLGWSLAHRGHLGRLPVGLPLK